MGLKSTKLTKLQTNVNVKKDIPVIIDNVDPGTANEYKLTLQHWHRAETSTLRRLAIPKRIYLTNEKIIFR